MSIDSDYLAYKKFTHHRKWFNKLWLSESFGYNCGPAGIAPDVKGNYIVRPVMNLSGMSVGAKKMCIDKGEISKVSPGFFWCEYFEGDQYSVTYQRQGDTWKQLSCWQGHRNEDNLSRFLMWERADNVKLNLPPLFDQLSDVGRINVEYIGDKPIEVHLRTSPDPDYDILIPIWDDQKNMVDKYKQMGYDIISSYDDADGHLDVPRIAFAVKNRKE